MRPSPVPRVPEGSGWQHGAKLDGFRAVAAWLPDRLHLHSRTGRRFTEFPELLALREALPAGTVLDGEICAVSAEGRMDFDALQRTAAYRRAHGIALSYTVFDLLADGEDCRPLPLTDRWARLTALLDSQSMVRPVLATDDREQALALARDLAPMGVEGIVSRRWTSRYDPRLSRGWVKWRTAESQDATVVGVVGPVRRPWAVQVRLGGTVVTTSPRLAPADAVRVGQRLEGHVGERLADAGGQPVHAVTKEVVAEVRRTGGRHSTTRFVRLRPTAE